MAVFAGFRLDRIRAAVELLIGDALGGFAQHAFDAHHVPLRGAQRAGAEPRAVGALPADDRGRYRRAAAGRADAVADRHRRGRIEPRRKPRKMHLQRGCDINVIGQRFDRNGIREHSAHHAVAGSGIGAAGALDRGAGMVRHVDSGGQGQEPIQRRIERGVGGEAAAVERRHGVLARPRASSVGRQIGLGQVLLDAMLAFAQGGEEKQIRPELMAFGQCAKAQRAGGE